MKNSPFFTSPKLPRLGLSLLGSVLALLAALSILHPPTPLVQAQTGDLDDRAPIPPAEGGFPKLDLSTKTVSPTLVSTGGETLLYEINIINTGSYTADGATLTDVLPPNTTYNNDAQATNGTVDVISGTLTWNGTVGFNATTVVSFSVTVAPLFSGTLVNQATINAPLIEEPVTVQAQATVADEPLFVIGKTADPDKLGPGKPLSYTLVVTNVGQQATSWPLTVTDNIPADTALRDIGPEGSEAGDTITWNRIVNLDFGEATSFTFSVDVDNVPAGTIISNDIYQVSSAAGIAIGDPHTTTIVLPSFKIFKETSPDPPGANREMTYILTVINQGSLATDLVVTDQVPAGVSYLSGGSEAGGTVTWNLSSLAPGETAEFTFTVDIGDVAEIALINDTYEVCSAEGVCQSGNPLTQIIEPATFEVEAMLDPIAKKPGGGPSGKTTVTPTLVIRNVGPGNAIDATARLEFGRISVNSSDFYSDPAIGSLNGSFDCGEKCVYFTWQGSLAVGEAITFTTIEGQSTIGGEEGTHYTATVVVSDTLNTIATEPVTAVATGTVTHRANLLPTKSAPEVIGPGDIITYTITVANSGLTTEDPPLPWLIDPVPTNTSVVFISDGGVTTDLSGTTVISWTLPKMGSGDVLTRQFSVQVDADLVSGTHILNSGYQAFWYETEDAAVFSNTGTTFTTTVQEVGLIDSFKTVSPTLLTPGSGGLLTFYVHIVNSSAVALTGVTVEDVLPWQHSTYQMDAIASGGVIDNEDIVSVNWTGDVAPFSEEVLTMTVEVNPGYEGPLTNTVTIDHPDLLSPIVRHAVAYVTDQPVLFITKIDSPDPVVLGNELRYTLQVKNLGEQATDLAVIDQIPSNTTYVAGSATNNGQFSGSQLQWQIATLDTNESRSLEFRVVADSGTQVVNDQYSVTSAEGASAEGQPVNTTIVIPTPPPAGGAGDGDVYLPIIVK